ncbi:unnamed protein product [Rotaria sp. Silwood2]|nr:unnamed protein product [Rotaria sp. Silwood2]
MTETTAGKLGCKRILFVNWSLPEIVTNEPSFRKSIRTFISRSIQYCLIGNQNSNSTIQSIAFAVPDSCHHERILAEEMINAAKQQIDLSNSVSLMISFVMLSDQEIFYEQFRSVIQNLQTESDGIGVLFWPISSLTITITSSDDNRLLKCQEKLSDYLKRCSTEIELINGFNNWNQHMINVYFKYCYDRRILIFSEQNQRIVLKGPISNIYEAKEKYDLLVALITQKIFIQQSSLAIIRPRSAPSASDGADRVLSPTIPTTCYNIMFSYYRKDSLACHYLTNRLISEGFSLWMNDNEINYDETLLQMKRSDCWIICISNNFYENNSFMNEVKYAKELGKPIISIKIENCRTVKWLAENFIDSCNIQMFGSEYHLDLEYDKLLLKVVSIKL